MNQSEHRRSNPLKPTLGGLLLVAPGRVKLPPCKPSNGNQGPQIHQICCSLPTIIQPAPPTIQFLFAIPISALYWLVPRVAFPWLLFPRPIKPSDAMTAWFLHLWCRQEACQRHQACRITWQLRKQFVPLLSRRRRASKEASRRRPIRAWRQHGRLLLEPPDCASSMSIMMY